MNQLWSTAPLHSIRRHMRCTCTQPAPCTSSISCPGTSRIIRRPPTYRRSWAHRRLCAGAARRRPLRRRRPPCGSTTRRRMPRPCRPPPRRRLLSPPGAHPTPGPRRRRSSAPAARPSPPTPRRRRTCASRPRRSMDTATHGASTASSECIDDPLNNSALSHASCCENHGG